MTTILSPLTSLANYSRHCSLVQQHSHHLLKQQPKPLFNRTCLLYSKSFTVLSTMNNVGATSPKEFPQGLDATCEEEYSSQSSLLQEFISIPTIEKAWTFASDGGSQGMFSVSQPNLLANEKRRYILTCHISEESTKAVSFKWAAFPIEMSNASMTVPSPSGSKLLVVRNPENDSPAKFEIWGPSLLEKEFSIPASVHGSVYSDGWFEGISWDIDETLIAYVAEEPAPSKPTFTTFGYKKENSTDKECGSWKGQGDWEEDWGETYVGKRQPTLFIIDVNSGEVRPVEGIGKSLSVGQVVWAPSNEGLQQYLVFVGWPSDTRKLGIKYCYNRPCALYAVRAPFSKLEGHQSVTSAANDTSPVKLTQSISSAFFPRFSPDGKFLLFMSSRSSVDSWAHSATGSLHRIDWSFNGKPTPDARIVAVVPVVMCPEDGCFPGLYCSSVLSRPWLSDGCTMILSSIWGSTQVIISVNVISGNISRISPGDSDFSWNVLALDGDNIIAVCSSPVDVPAIKYGSIVYKAHTETSWCWLDNSSPISRCSGKVTSLLSSLQFTIMRIPVRDISENLAKGPATKPLNNAYCLRHRSSSSRKRREYYADEVPAFLFFSFFFLSFIKSKREKMLGVSSGLMTNTSADGAATLASPALAPPPTATVAESGGSSEGGVGGGGDMTVAGGGFNEEGERNSGGNRWPRQETLALLRIRSEMDVVFRDSNLKGPLWEEVSRKLADLGYHRNAKKCKEKFENVYKYHRRTKDGRASKSDGKTYRFFEALEAFENNPSHSLPPPPLAATPITMAMPMRGNSTINNPPMPMSQSTASSTQTPLTVSQNTIPTTAAAATVTYHPLNNVSSFPPSAQPSTTLNQINPGQGNTSFLSNSTSSSSTSSDEDIQRRHGKKRKWKDFFERLMKDVIEKQEELQKKFMETLEKRERERMVREETWRVQEMDRINREHDLLVQERSMAAAKDATIIAFLQKITEQQNIQIPNSAITSPTQMQLQLPEKPLVVPPHSQPQKQAQQPPPPPAAATAVTLPMTIHAPVPTRAQSLPVAKILEAPKSDNGGDNFTQASSSRWPKEEIEALIRLRTCLDLKYQENVPKGPLWEEISIGMRNLGYSRNAKRCKEKWENINKYYKKVKESNKKRSEDSKTCPYFHQLEALYKEKAKHEEVANNTTAPPMIPIMAPPEQQWPLGPDQPQQQQAMNILQDRDNESDSMDDEEDEEDIDEDEDDGNNIYEIVTNKQPSSMVAATTTATTATV